MLLAVDPGVRGCGVSLWNPQGVLHAAAYVKGSTELDGPAAWRVMAYKVERWGLTATAADLTHLVIELPQVYRGPLLKGDPNDLIQLAAVVGAIFTQMDNLAPQEVLPARWKGQVPKAIHHNRIRAALTPEELTRVQLPTAASLAHNVWDAVGLGLWAIRQKGLRAC